MSNFNRTLIYSVFALSILFSCKKDSNNNPPAAVTIAFEKNDYVSFEVASLVSSETMNSTTYSATIDGTVGVTLDRTDSILVFIMPVLSTGAHTLKVDLGNGEQTLNFNIVQGNVIADPDQYFQNYVSVYDFRMLNNFSKGDTLLTGIDRSNFLADQQTITNNATLAIQNFSNLSLVEKNQVVQFLDANKAWMDELQASINDLKTIMGQLRVNVVDDYDLRVTDAMNNFLSVKREIVNKIPKIVSLVSASCLFLSPAGCAVAIGVGLGYFFTEIQDLNLTIDELMDAIYYPFYNLLGQRPVTVVFENGIPRDFVVTMDYRTLYSADGNSSVPLVQKIVGALFAIKNQWDLLLSKIPFSLSFGPKELNSISNYNTSNKRIHSRYLSVTDISSSQISVSNNSTDGYFYLTFNNPNLSSTQSFNFNVNYNNLDMGNFSYNVSADLNVSGPCTNSFSPLGSFVDSRDGNLYKTVTIGTKVWFAENLRFNAPGSDVVPGYPCDSYGRLYNWQIATTSCPSGWHLANMTEWTDLVNYAGGSNIAGLALKSTQGWQFNVTLLASGNGNNSIGFNVLPACRFFLVIDPTNVGPGYYASFWTSDEIDANNAKSTHLDYDYNRVSLMNTYGISNACDKNWSYSCRCVQD
jgi:uncharacterized protein (TIGR02145 family)